MGRVTFRTSVRLAQWFALSVISYIAYAISSTYLSEKFHFHYTRTLSFFQSAITFLLFEPFTFCKSMDAPENLPSSSIFSIALLSFGSSILTFSASDLSTHSTVFLTRILALFLISFLESSNLGQKRSPFVFISLVLFSVGSALFNVSQVMVDVWGFLANLAFAISTVLYVIQAYEVGVAYHISPAILLQKVSKYQTLFFLIIAVVFDLRGKNGIIFHEFCTKEVVYIVASSLISVFMSLCNYSVMLFTSPLTYQVMSQTRYNIMKLVSIYINFNLYGKEFLQSPKSVAGISLALIGQLLFFISKYKEETTILSAPKSLAEN